MHAYFGLTLGMLSLENHVLVILLPQNIIRTLRILLIATSSLSLLLFFSSIIVPLFVVLDLLQAVEFFPVHLVKLRVDIADRVFRPWDDDMLYSIDPAIHNFDDLVQDHKCCLPTVRLISATKLPPYL